MSGPRILLKLKGGYGLGDIVQFSIVLKHLARYRSTWTIEVCVPRGARAPLVGLCEEVYEKDEGIGEYDRVIDLHLSEHSAVYYDRPSTKVAWVLQSVFGINEYDPQLGTYHCASGGGDQGKAWRFLRRIAELRDDGRYNVVIVHFQGGSSTWKKNLAEWQASEMCQTIRRCGRVPLIVDFNKSSDLPDDKTIFRLDLKDEDLWGNFGGGDAGIMASFIRSCEAYIGIDSGPGKIASATDTPTLICWTKLHPIRFHDPADNTTHLIPANHEELAPEVPQYFHDHYRYQCYQGSHGLVADAQRWIARTLRYEEHVDPTSATFVIPDDLSTACWSLTKIRPIAAGRTVDVVLAHDPVLEVTEPASELLERFPFIRSVQRAKLPLVVSDHEYTNTRGRCNWLSSGWRENCHYLIPDAVLEEGRELGDWNPEYATDWDVFEEEFEAGIQSPVDPRWFPYVIFYMGTVAGNTTEGANRGPLWRSRDWVELTRLLKPHVANIFVVGTKKDEPFWNFIKADLARAGHALVDLVGKLDLVTLMQYAQMSCCSFFYPSGWGVLAHYLGAEVAMWWRADGDSRSSQRNRCHHDHMQTSWVRPEYAERYLPLTYGRHTPEQIVEEVLQRGWLRWPHEKV